MLEHGGKLRKAAEQFGIPLERWLDLSTGISPYQYSVPAVPAKAWHRLPEQEDGLLEASREYYGARHVLAVSGSQAAIQAVPRLWRHCKVGLFHPSYNEHEHAWRKNGHDVIHIAEQSIDTAADHLDAIVICNPNNPTGRLFQPEELLRWHKALTAHGGLLVVDEAFMDTTPEFSIAKHAHNQGLILLRSLGKFFGMGGARVGFVAAETHTLDRLEEELGPWTLSGPSRWAAVQALNDRRWQEEAREKLKKTSARLGEMLSACGFQPEGSTPFFQWFRHAEAKQLFEQLCKQAILARYYDDSSSIRFGLPESDQQFQRLQEALAKCKGTSFAGR